ncbi:uncharacterized protein BP5553_10295 [Venustampulla echinocandica]|uniref:Zn(2)-C6 fungal-type domain-containing protein n=1 Tax=Venustampulla echinocandica TaxID=2656787 RepID=A0A370T9S9_9HELO|nr:uncharacterized protein BP5553_10295 [Venustampulla echinocandica]RDL30417.1 hypothetical protein BP5553_10295 [Venustampulla echinocandica]
MEYTAPDAVGAGSSNNLRSIRSSCDRCRFHKLRCDRSASDGPVELPCGRCARAKTPCVLGRRRPANKRQPSVSTTKSSTSSTATTATTATADAEQHGETVTYPHPQASFPSQSQLPTPTPTSPTIPRATPSAQSWENQHDYERVHENESENENESQNGMSGMHDVADNHPGQENSMSGWGSMPQGMEFNLNDTFIFDADLLDPPPWLPAPILPDQSTDAATMMNTTSTAVPGQRLIMLIANMQQCLQILEHGPWQKDSANTLDDYPVGTVLHLSQELGSIASSVLSRGCIMGTITRREYVSETESPAGGEAHTTEPKGIDGGSDTVTPLLVLSGYMSLVRIYSIVLGHFQTHISSVPSNSNADHSSGMRSASTNPTLQLGELPCTSVAPILGKIHTALRMLLAAVHGVEEKLGPGGAVARNLVVALLAQDAVLDIGDFHGGLLTKMQLVKEILQEKMNL